MSAQSLEERMDAVERQVAALQGLPAQVAELGTQILQLRTDMDARLSATTADLRAEIRAGDEATRQTIQASEEETRRQIRECKEEIRSEIRECKEEIRGEIGECKEEIRGEIRESQEETRRFMRVLHEDVIDRIKHLGEAPPSPRSQVCPRITISPSFRSPSVTSVLTPSVIPIVILLVCGR